MAAPFLEGSINKRTHSKLFKLSNIILELIEANQSQEGKMNIKNTDQLEKNEIIPRISGRI